MIKGQCSGSNRGNGGVQGGMRRGRKVVCPVCGRRIAMRPGRNGTLYAHAASPATRPSGWAPDRSA